MPVRRLLAVLAALMTFGGLFGRPAAAPAQAAPLEAPPAAVDVTAAEAQFLELLNADRAAHELPPLQVDARLMEVARWRSEDMLARNYFSHDLGGFTIGRVLRQRQISFVLAGENLTINTYDDAQTVAMAEADLMDSAPHRANILRPEFNLVGVGIATGPDRRTVYTQVFVQG